MVASSIFIRTRIVGVVAVVVNFILCAPMPVAGGQTPTTKPAQAPIRIVLAGDSTVAAGSGWGPGFEETLQPGVECINLARGGQSSKSFRDSGMWEKVLDAKPNFVLIQFGHNDMPGKGPARETDPATTYRQNMTRFVAEVREAGAVPILVTSIPRRHFTSEGKIKSDLVDYVEAVKAVAADRHVLLVDLHALNIELLDKLGPKGSEDWNPTVKRKRGDKEVEGPDTTHLTPKASQIVGKLVADELKKLVPDLRASLK